MDPQQETGHSGWIGRIGDRWIFLILVVLVTAFRAVTVRFLFNGDPLADSGDAVQYHYFGLAIAQDPAWYGKHLGVVPPLYPFFLAGVYRFFGDCPMCALYAQTVLAGLTAGVIYLLGKKVFHPAVGILSSLFFMVHPSAVTWGGVLIRETLIMLLFAITLQAALEVRRRATDRGVALLGLAFGLLLLTDPRFLFYAPFLALYLWLPFRTGAFGWRPALLLTGVVVLVLVPWTVRNYSTYHKLTLIDTRTLAFMEGKDASDQSYIHPPREVSELARRHNPALAAGPAGQPPSGSPTDRTPGLLDKVWYNFEEFWRICRFRASDFPVYRPVWSRSHNYGSLLYFIPLIGLTVAGIALFRSRDRVATVVLAFPILGHTLLHMFAPYSNTRYRMPIEIPMILFAMYAVVRLAERWFGRGQGEVH